MSRKTISFVATEELANWLESEAEERMTTVSSAAQQLLVEKYRDRGSDPVEGDDGDEGLFDRWSDKWARPDSDQYLFRVYNPDGDGRYFKTRKGAEDAIRRWYDDEKSQDGGG